MCIYRVFYSPLIHNVSLPYVNEIREVHPLDGINKKTISNVIIFAAHQTHSLLDKLKSYNIPFVFVPAVCTDKLSLNVTVSYDHKEMLKGSFTNSIPPYF